MPETGSSPSLADPIGASPLLSALGWLEGTVVGTLATSAAVVAIAALGLMMLQGRLPLRRGATVLLGCFVLFGASSIASGIMASIRTVYSPNQISVVDNGDTGVFQNMLAATPPTYDPYAGASVPPR